MSTATYSSSTANNLWNLIQGLSLTSTDRHWLADRLTESYSVPQAGMSEVVFPTLPQDAKPSKELRSMSLGPVPEGFDIDREIELMWEERAK